MQLWWVGIWWSNVSISDVSVCVLNFGFYLMVPNGYGLSMFLGRGLMIVFVSVDLVFLTYFSSGKDAYYEEVYGPFV